MLPIQLLMQDTTMMYQIFVSAALASAGAFTFHRSSVLHECKRGTADNCQRELGRRLPRLEHIGTGCSISEEDTTEEVVFGNIVHCCYRPSPGLAQQGAHIR
jgi:hypothetical protein